MVEKILLAQHLSLEPAEDKNSSLRLPLGIATHSLSAGIINLPVEIDWPQTVPSVLYHSFLPTF